MSIPVLLTDVQWEYASSIGMKRHISCVRKGYKDAYGLNPDREDGWGKNIEGACGEYAVAIALNVHWHAPIDTFKSGSDVDGHQVRTASRHNYGLTIRPDDREDQRFILVTGKAPNFQVHGWYSAKVAKRHNEWYTDYGNGRPSVYCVPQKALRPIEELKKS